MKVLKSIPFLTLRGVFCVSFAILILRSSFFQDRLVFNFQLIHFYILVLSIG